MRKCRKRLLEVYYLSTQERVHVQGEYWPEFPLTLVVIKVARSRRSVDLAAERNLWTDAIKGIQEADLSSFSSQP